MSGQRCHETLAKAVAETIKGEISLPKEPRQRQGIFYAIKDTTKIKRPDWMQEDGKPAVRRRLVETRNIAVNDFFFDYFKGRILKSEDADIDHALSCDLFLTKILPSLQALAKDQSFRQEFMEDATMCMLFAEDGGNIYITRYGLIAFFNNLHNLHLLNRSSNCSKSAKAFLGWLEKEYAHIYQILALYLKERKMQVIVGIVGLFAASSDERYEFCKDINATLHRNKGTQPFLDVLYQALRAHTKDLDRVLLNFHNRVYTPFYNEINGALQDGNKPITESRARTYDIAFSVSQEVFSQLSEKQEDGSLLRDQMKNKFFHEAIIDRVATSKLIMYISNYVIQKQYSTKSDEDCHADLVKLLSDLSLDELQEVFSKVKEYQKKTDGSFFSWLKIEVSIIICKRQRRTSVCSSVSSQNGSEEQNTMDTMLEPDSELAELSSSTETQPSLKLSRN